MGQVLQYIAAGPEVSTDLFARIVRSPSEVRQTIRRELPRLREEFGIDRLGVCGSFARGDQTDDSDVDVLVAFEETPDLYEFVRLKLQLEELLGLEVDLGTPDSLSEGPAARSMHDEVEFL